MSDLQALIVGIDRALVRLSAALLECVEFVELIAEADTSGAAELTGVCRDQVRPTCLQVEHARRLLTELRGDE